jgi:hypothetical protein
MGEAQLGNLLYLIRLFAFEICETLVFVALAVSLTIHTIRLIIEFGRKQK